jgi:hypothetical protein
MDREKAKRRDLTPQPQRDSRKQPMQRQTAMAEFAAKHDLSFGLSEAVGEGRREWSWTVGDLRRLRARKLVARPLSSEAFPPSNASFCRARG